jgi:hypothetical protein
MKQRNPKKGWTPSWSSRGTALLNFIETACIGTTTQRINVSKEDKHMLRDLLRRYPANEFYKSLARQLVVHGGLTSKQVQGIHSDHKLL